jgi:hypothetical protein
VISTKAQDELRIFGDLSREIDETGSEGVTSLVAKLLSLSFSLY